jgi:hypothetical protein
LISIRDEHLERMIDRERIRRGDATQAKTLRNVAHERLLQLVAEGVYGQSDSQPDKKSLKGAARALAG